MRDLYHDSKPALSGCSDQLPLIEPSRLLHLTHDALAHHHQQELADPPNEQRPKLRVARR
jgi:hypothetical protein